ncbi:NAD(P)-binding domain-containing protein [Humibacter ginsengiterrae]
MSLTLTVPPRTDAPRLAGLPVAVIGAGPVGLAAAAHLLERGVEVVVYEAGPSAGTAILAWGHTRLFSPWRYVTDAASVRLLEKTGSQQPPATELPTGTELVEQYVTPLAATPELASRIFYNTRVKAVSRQGMDRTRSTGRADTPFLLRLAAPGGTTERLARAVIDASGTYSTPNTLNASGLPLTSGAETAAVISHALPDVLGTERDRFAGKHTLVVGAGHSAANTLLKLAELARQVPGTTITWAIRGNDPVRVYGSNDDALEARGKLGSVTHDLVRYGAVALIDRFEIDDLRPLDSGRVSVLGRRAGEPATIKADVVVNATGFRPDIDMLREIRLGLDDVVEAPRLLAPLIDPNLHSCGTVPPHGVTELTHPEPNFFLAGMKSYGRAPTFLLLTGYEQVRSIAAELAGDHQSARDVQLVLPEIGVCSTDTAETFACCGSPAAGGCS